MKKGIIFIGPADSGKSRKAREIANRCLKPEAVWIDGRKRHIQEDPFLFGDCTVNTELVIIDDLKLSDLEFFFFIISESVHANIMGGNRFEISPQIIITLRSEITKEMLPKGASFTRRFDVYEFPNDLEINI